MKYIPLTRGQQAIVDDEDFDRLNEWKWKADYRNKHFYGRGYQKDHERGKFKLQQMSRVVLGVVGNRGVKVDHRNHDTLDNRKENLRLCSVGQNCQNRIKISRMGSRTSKYKGVSWSKRSKKWKVTIKTINHLGYYSDEVEAAKAYDAAAKQYFGEFALLNFPEGA